MPDKVLESSIKSECCDAPTKVEIKKSLRLVCSKCGKVVKGNQPVVIEKVTPPDVNLEK